MSNDKLTLKGSEKDGAQKNPLLSEDEIATLKAQAAKEVAEDFKAKEAEALKKQFKMQLREEHLASTKKNRSVAGDQQITIDLPEGSKSITIDGEMYRTGHTYFVTQAVKATLVSMMFKVKEHFEETRLGKPARFFSVKRTRSRPNA